MRKDGEIGIHHLKIAGVGKMAAKMEKMKSQKKRRFGGRKDTTGLL